MERTKLISIRVETETLKAIDRLCKGRPYLNRSAVINKLLEAIVFCCEGNGLFQIINCYSPLSEGIALIVVNEKLG